MKKIIKLTDNDIKRLVKESIDEINRISNKNQVTVASLDDFKVILQDNNINDDTVDDYIGKYAFIEIGSGANNIEAKITTFPKDGYDETNWYDFYSKEQWCFHHEHENVLRLEYDDIVNPPKNDDEWQNVATKAKEQGVPQNSSSPFKNKSGFKYKGVARFTDEIANNLKNFVDKNIALNPDIRFIVHCHQGASRSFAVGTYIQRKLKGVEGLNDFFSEYTSIDPETNKATSQFRLGNSSKRAPRYGHSTSLSKMSNLEGWDDADSWFKEPMNNFAKNNHISKSKKDWAEWDNELKECVNRAIKSVLKEEVGITGFDLKNKTAQLQYKTGNIGNRKKCDYLETNLMDNLANGETHEVPLKGGIISYNITGIVGTAVMHYFKNYFEQDSKKSTIKQKYTTVNQKGNKEEHEDEFQLEMKKNEFSQFMNIFMKKVQKVIDVNSEEELKKERSVLNDFQFDSVCVYPVPSRSHFNTTMAKKMKNMQISFCGQNLKLDIIDPRILEKDLRELEIDQDFVEANDAYYKDTMGARKSIPSEQIPGTSTYVYGEKIPGKFSKPVTYFVQSAMNKFKIVYKEISDCISKANQSYDLIINSLKKNDDNSVIKHFGEYADAITTLRTDTAFVYSDLRKWNGDSNTDIPTTIIKDKFIYVDRPDDDIVTKRVVDIIKRNGLKKGETFKKVEKIKRVKPIQFEIKNLPDNVRMALRNIYNPIRDNAYISVNPENPTSTKQITGEKLKERELSKIQTSIIIIFDDNVSGGATLSDVCYQLNKLGAKHIIPITFGQMGKKETAKDDDNRTVFLNTPTDKDGKKQFNFPTF